MAETNVLRALIQLVNNPIADLHENYVSNNRANSMGEALETYMKDLFCGVTYDAEENVRKQLYEKHLSYEGNQNNPPDFLIRQGDAVEVKKLRTLATTIQLNSSFPKDTLCMDDPRITSECRQCEQWTQKDLLYVIGVVVESTVRNLCFAYGDCFVANSDVYTGVHESITSAISNLEDLHLGVTRELGRVEEIDLLRHTSLRIRGMWILDNPIAVFNFSINPPKESFAVSAIMLKQKYLQFPSKDRNTLEVLEKITIEDRKIPSPNNPNDILDAVVIMCILPS